VHIGMSYSPVSRRITQWLCSYGRFKIKEASLGIWSGSSLVRSMLAKQSLRYLDESEFFLAAA
jgi:hypothetical protein